MGSFPEFYCCYLLQSINKRQSFYIGSTPNPQTRLRQHNGSLINGGAYKTKRLGTRPWEMTMIVYGFPNKIVALQFEHAWQHAYQTRYIDESERIIRHKAGGRSMHHKVSSVMLLLKHPFFNIMNLKVHFFSGELKRTWDQNKFKIDLSFNSISESDNINIVKKQGLLSVEEILQYAEINLELVTAFYKNKVALDRMILERYKAELVRGEMNCDICQEKFNYISCEKEVEQPYISFCVDETCHFVCHLSCLRNLFFEEQPVQQESNSLIPLRGNCPFCSQNMEWVDIIKYSSQLKDICEN